jgi:hypothetical protein
MNQYTNTPPDQHNPHPIPRKQTKPINFFYNFTDAIINKVCQNLTLNNQTTKLSTGTFLDCGTDVKHGAATDRELDIKNNF